MRAKCEEDWEERAREQVEEVVAVVALLAPKYNDAIAIAAPVAVAAAVVAAAGFGGCNEIRPNSMGRTSHR